MAINRTHTPWHYWRNRVTAHVVLSCRSLG